MLSLGLDLTTCPPTDSQMAFELEIVTHTVMRKLVQRFTVTSLNPQSCVAKLPYLRFQSVLGQGTGPHNLGFADGHTGPGEGES